MIKGLGISSKSVAWKSIPAKRRRDGKQKRLVVDGEAQAKDRRKHSAQIIAQLTAAAWVAQAAERLGFDLADTLTGDPELFPDFF